MKKLLTSIFLILFSCILTIQTLNEVWARAWGWKSSRSSSSSSSRSSSSNYSNSSSYWWGSYSSSSSSWSTSWVWIIIIFIIIIVIIAFYSANNKSKNNSNINNSTPNQEQKDFEDEIAEFEEWLPETARDIDSKISELKAKDPDFNEQMFEDKVSTAFFKIQNARSKADMNLARAFITDSVLNRFNMQLEEFRESKTRNKIEWLTLDNVEILDVKQDSTFDRIDILITATAKDYIVDENGEYVEWNKDEFTTWDEKWGFVRTAWVLTNADKSVFSEKCPNCWAPLKVNATWECEYCNSTITTGKFDWVLSEITQLN